LGGEKLGGRKKSEPTTEELATRGESRAADKSACKVPRSLKKFRRARDRMPFADNFLTWHKQERTIKIIRKAGKKTKKKIEGRILRSPDSLDCRRFDEGVN